MEQPRQGSGESVVLSRTVQAAGAVVWRRGPHGRPETLLIHRPRYDDWSFPKGKLKRGESDEDAALRELEEEVGIRAELGPELLSTSYRDAKGRQKTVRYWAIELPESVEPIAGDGVDQWRWVSLEEAADELTWDRDRGVLDSLRELV
jgi:8-oxo-dGTP pyrophosphatase MutT (NUDIX family)